MLCLLPITEAREIVRRSSIISLSWRTPQKCHVFVKTALDLKGDFLQVTSGLRFNRVVILHALASKVTLIRSLAMN